MKDYTLGISCFFHDSAAALICDGEIIAAAQEERFTRIKQDEAFPINAIDYVLSEAKISLEDVSAIVYYEKPFWAFERLLENFLFYSPRGYKTFLKAIPVWLREKLFPEQLFKRELKKRFLNQKIPPIFYSNHHLSHAASAFYPSPYEESLILTVDGVGELATTALFIGKKNQILPVQELHFPHSLGLFYSAITGYLGFKVNSGEYKVMGLAPYGQPKFTKLFLEKIFILHDDGSFSLALDYFEYMYGLRMYSSKLEELLGRKAREPETLLEDFHMDVAASLQETLEIVLLHIIKAAEKISPIRNLCLAGGVALNCVANAKILKNSQFKNIWVQPASGDAGGALGAALAYYYLHKNGERKLEQPDSQKSSYLGPSFSHTEIEEFLKSRHLPIKKLSDEDLFPQVAKMITEEKIIGWFDGRMEYGPRALGNRSILGDPRVANMQKRMNLKIKYRESFRPFAPIVLEEDTSRIFDFYNESPYMLFVADVKKEHQKIMTKEEESLFGIEKLNIPRSIFPSITHVDYSARLQTVAKSESSRISKLLTAFKTLTGYGLLVNTSFNVRGEPIVCTPLDAYRCFCTTEIDVLVLGNYYLERIDIACDPNPFTTREVQLD